MKGYQFPDHPTPVKVTDTVCVIGAGNVAMDAARTAKRLGAKNVYIVYRRGPEEVPARAEEVHHAKEEGIIFIGPSAETMEAMGDKISARKRMIAAGVPVVPGTQQPLQDVGEARRICREIGFPVMLKASMGGGGKGMRLIHCEEEVEEAYNAARSESLSSFGDDTVYLEKFCGGTTIISNSRF